MKAAKDMPRQVLMGRVGIHHRLIFRSEGGNLDVIDLITREQLQTTLKRLRRKGASVALEAANPAYETRIFGPDRIRIQGRLTGLLRKY